MKGMNEETDCFSRAGLVARALWSNFQFGVRAQMSNVARSAQQGLHSNPVNIGVSSHKGLVELACCRSNLSFHLLAIACCVVASLLVSRLQMPVCLTG